MPLSRIQAEARKALLRRGVLPLIEQDQSLDVILQRIIENVEAQSESMLAAVFFYNPKSQELSVGSAPNLKPAYLQAVNGFKIGPNHASCGTAVFRRERIINHDVKTDPLWENYRFAENFFRAVWSQPIFSASGDVLGTLAFYFQEPKSPDEAEMMVLEGAAALVALAIQARPQDFTSSIEKR
jgi:GAF domain-containing protein